MAEGSMTQNKYLKRYLAALEAKRPSSTTGGGKSPGGGLNKNIPHQYWSDDDLLDPETVKQLA